MLVADLIEVLQQLPATAPAFVRVHGRAITIDAADYSGGQVRITLDQDELADVLGLGDEDEEDDDE